MKRVLVVLAYAIGGFLVARAVAQPFVIDLGDPDSYRDDWGGPTLAGVLAVHCLPGVVALAAMVWYHRRHRRDQIEGRSTGPRASS